MLHIHESTNHKLFVTCAVLMEVMLPCFNLKPDDCNQATTILLLKRSQLHQTLTLGKLGIFLNKILLILNKTHPGSISDFNVIEKNLM